MTAKTARGADSTVYAVLFAAAFTHLLNDMLQSLLPASYPALKADFDLNFTQIGLITLAYQTTGSLCQPLFGWIGDRKPRPYMLPLCMISTAAGLVAVAHAPSYGAVLAGVTLMGLGSSVFHPETSRVARLASGGRHGFAQSLFQVGGNAGLAISPLMAAFVVLIYGRSSLAWFAAVAAVGFAVLWKMAAWHAAHGAERRKASPQRAVHELPRARVALALGVLLALIFSKYVYLASFTNYYIFYLIERFGMGVQTAQLHLFAFLGAIAVGTFAGGPIGDRIGRKRVIWFSILGVLPFTLALPWMGATGTAVLSVIIGLILASAFSAIVVFAQELLPQSVGMVAGLMFGFSFGVSGVAAAALGLLADAQGIETVYRVCAFLPLMGLLAAFLPDLRRSPAPAPLSLEP
jgi:MFS transporter, FSR family, fosmidomycin resistance protein